MKKTIFLFLLLALVIGGWFFWHHSWVLRKDVIYLNGGQTIVVDRYWQDDNTVYYEDAQTVFMLPKRNVEQIVADEYLEQTTGAVELKKGLAWMRRKLTAVFRADLSGWKVDRRKAKQLAWTAGPWVLGFLLLLVAIRLFSSRKRKDAGAAVPEPQPSSEKSRQVTERTFYSLEDQIAYFFLTLFKHQLDVPEEVEAGYRLYSDGAAGKNKIYELRVWQKGEWITRRMTIGPLGEESGSRSKCFFVIYDVHMVLKIPPKPINSFQSYIASIRLDNRIVEKLAPRECIIPRISVILKRIRRFGDEDTVGQEKIEERYVRWLSNRKEMQNYLRIANTFVYFMDLSRYFFLGRIIENLHNIEQKLAVEIRSNPGLIWDLHAFAGRYRRSENDIAIRMQRLFQLCEQDLRRQMLPGEASDRAVNTFQMKDWFLCHLAKQEVPEGKGLSAKRAAEVNARLGEHFAANVNDVENYRELVEKYIRYTSFVQNKLQFGNIVTNLLDLLAWLGGKKVAIRDLKPDNLLVAGDPADYPRFLASADHFHIGLIDVETAVCYDAGSGDEIRQPPLGGTPYYAIPAHLFPNYLLTETFDDLSTALHLQDWHATFAMIYKMVTGKTLFEKTGRLFPVMRAKLREVGKDRELRQDVVREISRMFWQSAEDEFFEKMSEQKKGLSALKAVLPESVTSMLRQELGRAVLQVEKTLQMLVQEQTLFPGERNHRRLLGATRRQIMQFRQRFSREGEMLEPGDRSRRLAENFLESLEKTKSAGEKLTAGLNKLAAQTPSMTVDELVTLMFYRVMFYMLKAEWQAFFQRKAVDPGTEVSGEKTYDATI